MLSLVMKSMKMIMARIYLLLKNGLIRQSIPKVFMLIKKYVLLESNAEITKAILDKMDTVKKVRFIGPIIWFLANFFKNK